MNLQVFAVGGAIDFHAIHVDFVTFDSSLLSLFGVPEIMVSVFPFDQELLFNQIFTNLRADAFIYTFYHFH